MPICLDPPGRRGRVPRPALDCWRSFDGPDARRSCRASFPTTSTALATGPVAMVELQLAQGPDAGDAAPVARGSAARYARWSPPTWPRRCASACRCSCCAPRCRSPTSAACAVFGVGGAGARRCRARGAWRAPRRRASARIGDRDADRPARRPLVVVGPSRERGRAAPHSPPTPAHVAPAVLALARHPRRRADDRRRDAGPVRPADGQLGPAGRRRFPEGLLPGQEIVARMQYLGRLKERLQRSTSTAAAAPAPASTARPSATRPAAPWSTPRPRRRRQRPARRRAMTRSTGAALGAPEGPAHAARAALCRSAPAVPIVEAVTSGAAPPSTLRLVSVAGDAARRARRRRA